MSMHKCKRSTQRARTPERNKHGCLFVDRVIFKWFAKVQFNWVCSCISAPLNYIARTTICFKLIIHALNNLPKPNGANKTHFQRKQSFLLRFFLPFIFRGVRTTNECDKATKTTDKKHVILWNTISRHSTLMAPLIVCTRQTPFLAQLLWSATDCFSFSHAVNQRYT